MPGSRVGRNTAIVKSIAHDLGFLYCGISKAQHLTDEARNMENWLKQGKHGQMRYLTNHFEKRMDPRQLVPGAKTVVTLLYNYFPKKDLGVDGSFKISKYAYGEDYHFVIKRKLKQLVERIGTEIGEIDGRVFVDSAPVMERAWAQKSGAGWIGKNSLLLNKNRGSFFFLAELISDLGLEEDGPVMDYCGTCTRCIDACPTDAINQPYSVDGSKCISYFTIELKDAIPEWARGQYQDWIFGCDICQDVCPWNQFSSTHSEADFEPHPKLAKMETKDWIEMTEAVFDQMFKQSALKRAKFKGLQRNIAFLKKG